MDQYLSFFSGGIKEVGCPQLSDFNFNKYNNLISDISKIDEYYRRQPSRGLANDLKCTCASMFAQSDESADNKLLRRLLLRPSAPPIVYSYLSKFRDEPFSGGAWVDDLVSALVGRNVSPRDGDVFSTKDSSGIRVKYPAAAVSGSWLPFTQLALSKNIENPVASAGISYAAIVLNHPYADGNGRIARAFLQGSLHRSGIYSSPFLPIDTAFSLSGVRLIRSLKDLSDYGNWKDYLEVFSSIISNSLKLHHKYCA